MDDTSFSPRSEELSAEDLAIIQAFDATDDLVVAGNLDEQQIGMQTGTVPLEKGGSGADNPEDMLMLFASEADEDIATMRRALQDLEQDNQRTSPGLVTLGRAAHKLKGTAGAMGCEAMSAIALQIEEELHLIRDGKVVFLTGVMALVHAINALEITLKSVLENGQESTQPLQELLQDMGKLNVPSEQLSTQEVSPSRSAPKVADSTLAPLVPQLDSRNLHTLISHTEHLVELNTSLQSVQKQISKSLMELQAAHSRLRHLEGLLSNVAFPGLTGSESGQSAGDHPASSLVARILQRGGRQQRPRTTPSTTPPGLPSESALWDEMEMDRFTEHKILLQSFSEAVADVATASSQLRAAFTQLNTLLDQQTNQTMVIRDDTLRLRSVPFSILLERVRQIIQDLAQKHNRQIQLEVKGETIELDQDILEALAEPFLNMIRANVTDSLLSTPLSPHQEPDRIWLQAQAVGNEIVIELGFSMPIPGGALEALRAPIQQLHGSIAARRNPSGGVLYQLRFPRTQGLVQGLLVQAGGQGLILPLAHIDLIDYKHQEPSAQVYNLASLLGFPQQVGSTITAPLILLSGSQRRVALQVDEIISEVELITKPLDKHLQRPGIVGTAVDGSGNVLLIVDLPALIRYGFIQRSRAMFKAQGAATSAPAQSASGQLPAPAAQQQPATILVADDSVYIRQSLRQTFERAGYEVIEARDGIEALEYLSSDQPPAVMLLDIEMPNLNGYDLLNILHSRPGFADCKTILLTSRSSEKHRQRAMELGAYAFLGKPCAQDVLLDTVYKALADMPAPT